jgi:LmeA-like phospholipid-binding
MIGNHKIMSQEHRLEEEMLSKVAETQISNQIDKAEKIDVDVQTDLLKVVQGQADAVAFEGEGLVMQKDIRIQEIKVQTDSIAVNPLSAILGQIELSHPVNTAARIVLLEDDMNRALTSEYVRSKMQKYDLNVDGKIVSFEVQQIQIFLPEEGKMGFQGRVLLREPEKTQHIGFTAMVRPRTLSQPIKMESFNCTEGEGISLETIVALMQKVKELVNLPYYTFDGTAFRIKNMQVEKEKLTLLVEAKLQQIPSTLTKEV